LREAESHPASMKERNDEATEQSCRDEHNESGLVWLAHVACRPCSEPTPARDVDRAAELIGSTADGSRNWLSGMFPSIGVI
jgi:hypothetical protein